MAPVPRCHQLGEPTLDVSGTFPGEAIRVPIQIAALHHDELQVALAQVIDFMLNIGRASGTQGSNPAPSRHSRLLETIALRLRGIEEWFAHGSPLEQRGFEPLVPLTTETLFQNTYLPPRAAHRLKPDLLRPEGDRRFESPFAPAASLVRTHHAALEKRGIRAPLQRETDDRLNATAIPNPLAAGVRATR